MGDTSVMARRLADGHVQYGWSGNGGYFRVVGLRLLAWYKDPEDVEYLFGLGQTSFIGKKGSEKGGFGWMETHSLTGEPCWLDQTERMIFSKLAFVDYGYFYDADQKWYYIVPGPFRIKMPLELVYNNLDEDDFEFDFMVIPSYMTKGLEFDCSIAIDEDSYDDSIFDNKLLYVVLTRALHFQYVINLKC